MTLGVRRFWGLFCIITPIVAIPLAFFAYKFLLTLVGSDAGSGDLESDSIIAALAVFGFFAVFGLAFIPFGIYLLKRPNGLRFQTGEYHYVGFWFRVLMSFIDGVVTMFAWPLQILFYFKYGTSIGKVLLGARILDEKTSKVPSGGSLWGRTLLKNLFLNIPYIGSLFFIPVGVTKKKQGWHDSAAGTIVVRPMGAKVSSWIWAIPALLLGFVVVGIIATIATATFSGYNKKVRDVERESFVRNAQQILIADQIAVDVPNYESYDTVEKMNQVLAAQGYEVPAPSNGNGYMYFAKESDFVIAVCSEDPHADNPIFIAGSGDVILNDVECSEYSRVPTVVYNSSILVDDYVELNLNNIEAFNLSEENLEMLFEDIDFDNIDWDDVDLGE